MLNYMEFTRIHTAINSRMMQLEDRIGEYQEHISNGWRVDSYEKRLDHATKELSDLKAIKEKMATKEFMNSLEF